MQAIRFNLLPGSHRGMDHVCIPRRRSSQGFSFVEVMFATVVLGIGAILVAAIFPVAIEQTQNSADDAIAAQVVRDAAQYIQTNTTAESFPDTGGATQSFASVQTLWNQVNSAVIEPTDARYAWVPFFCKSSDDARVTLTIIAVRRVIHQQYTPADMSAGTGELVPRGIQILKVTPIADGSSTIEIAKDPAGSFLAVAPNAFVVLASTGESLRVGEQQSETSDSVIWNLQPGQGVIPASGFGYAAVIGRDWLNAADPSSGYAGPAQDVAVYRTIFLPH